jgi:hypothetical protein
VFHVAQLSSSCYRRQAGHLYQLIARICDLDDDEYRWVVSAWLRSAQIAANRGNHALALSNLLHVMPRLRFFGEISQATRILLVGSRAVLSPQPECGLQRIAQVRHVCAQACGQSTVSSSYLQRLYEVSDSRTVICLITKSLIYPELDTVETSPAVMAHLFQSIERVRKMRIGSVTRVFTAPVCVFS